MQLSKLRISNFQSFGPNVTEIDFDNFTFLIGANGTGKTAILQALCRMFSPVPSLRSVKKLDFHVPDNEKDPLLERSFFIEAEFSFPELADKESECLTVPENFRHMFLRDGEAVICFKLEATLTEDGDIESDLYYISIEKDEETRNPYKVSRHERNLIQVHYLPARRDPSDHISTGTHALMGKLLKSIKWDNEKKEIQDLTDGVSTALSNNESIQSIDEFIKNAWDSVHTGKYFTTPSVTFGKSDIGALLKHLSISFSPSYDSSSMDYTLLSDGQKSMLYLSLVLASQAVGRSVIKGENASFEQSKLNPAIFTIIALEEPENSLSPHYLGRIVSVLTDNKNDDTQALIATHAPSMLRRINPENIRYLKLNESRTTEVKKIKMPLPSDEAHKYVQQAVQAFPELYFSRLVILGEGASEEIVLPRLLSAKGIAPDEHAISVVPLGGRHVNHFWRLLNDLDISFVTLLDLDLARHQGGWGRIKYVNDQLGEITPINQLPSDFGIPSWDDSEYDCLKHPNYLEELEKRGVFFSSPLDLDLSMLTSFSDEYEHTDKMQTPSEKDIVAVLGASYSKKEQYTDEQQAFFIRYNKCFKLSSKPASHIEALSKLKEEKLSKNMPKELSNLIDLVKEKLEIIPE